MDSIEREGEHFGTMVRAARGGAIPHSIHIEWTDNLDAAGKFKSNEELAELFKSAGIDVGKPVVTTCGSGVTASMLALALASLGQTNAAVYDGSWAEWGIEGNGLPFETGPAK